MYLSDRDIKVLLPQLEFTTSDSDDGFKPDQQIQPCSIDLRLDRVFWIQRKHKRIDLRNARLLEMEPRRHWYKMTLTEGHGISLKPGQMILGRTFESFHIPRGHAGKLEGRSSFARMGLAIHCSADFINPGYGGHMPLQLINQSQSTITLFAKLPICQLMVIRLTSDTDRVYGDRELYSKYINDDGGPSYWWRDKRVKSLHAALGKRADLDEIQEEVLRIIASCEPEVIERFEKLVERMPAIELTNSDELLDRFAAGEDTASRLARLRRNLLLSVGPTLGTISIGSLFRQPYSEFHYIFWGLTVLGLSLSSWVYFRGDPPGEFFDTRELERRRRASGKSDAILE